MTDSNKPPGEARIDAGRMFHLLMENVKDFGIFMLDPAGRVVGWNAGAERILGYTDGDIMGKPFNLIFTAEDREAQRPEQELKAARENGRADDERWHVRKDGSRFWASGVVTPLWDDAGTLQGFAKVLRDITDRKKTEEELEEANRRKDEFLAMLAHELRNPLAPILNAVHLVKREPASSPTLQQAGGIIERQLGRVVRIVDDLLDVSRITRGKIQLRKERVTLQAVVNHAVETVRSFIESRKHSQSVALPPEAIWLEADPLRLEQVLVNLLNNAAKYTEPGGKISITAERVGNECELKVRDTGVGIVAEMLPRVFDLFVQADKSLDRSQGGLGIGLTLVKKLVAMHGGTVEARSEGIGHGSEFVVRLPVVPEVAGLKPEQAPQAAQKTQNPLRVLIVDDNVDTAESLAMLLKLFGHETRVAHTGQRALQMAVVEKPDVLVLDIGLPGMDGYEVAQRIRQHGELANVRLIAVSGYGQDADRKRSEVAGFNHHLVKPVDPAKLQELLSEQEA
jgi:PAS domain S-box-containing protein